MFHNITEFIILLYTFLVASFLRYKEFLICLISVYKFSGVLPAFACASTQAKLVIFEAFLWDLTFLILFPFFALRLAAVAIEE